MKQLPIIYNQQDPRWASTTLGTGPGTIGTDGCYITSFAIVGEYYGKTFTPSDINSFMINAGLFVNGDDVGNDDDLNKIFGDITFVEIDSYLEIPADLSKLQGYMQDNTIMVILEIDLGNDNTHFVVCQDCDGTNVTIANPWSGKSEPFTQDYGDPATNILKYVVYKGTPQAQGTYVDATTFGTLVSKSTNWDAVVALGFTNPQAITTKINALNTTIDSLNGTVNDKNATISSQTQELSSMTTQVATLQDQLNQAQTIAKQVPVLQTQLQQAENDRTACLSAQESQNKTIAQLKSQLTASKPVGFWNKMAYLFG